MMTSLRIQTSAIHGMGLFTTRPLRAGEQILKITGRVVDTNDLSDDFIRRGLFQCIVPGRAVISATGERGPFSYVNHSSDCNCHVELRTMRLLSLRAIAPGEELTVDYTREPLDERLRRIVLELIRPEALQTTPHE